MAPANSGLTIAPVPSFAAGMTSLFKPPSSTIRGIKDTSWFGPMQPVNPIAPSGTEPRGQQYWAGRNLSYTPRANEPLKAGDLREFAMYDMVRVIIENVLDQICKLTPKVRLRQMPGQLRSDLNAEGQKDKTLQRIQSFLEYPNAEQSWSDFCRKILDDMLVIDAASILLRTNPKNGALVELRAIDGATITRYIDEQGYTPLPPSPAYAQLWYGTPMVDLTTDQLLYAPRNMKTYRFYGMSPVEQAFKWIGIGRERLTLKANFYTAGNIPDGIIVVPKGVGPDLIKEAQEQMNSDLAGQLAKRHQIRYVQGFTEDGTDKMIFPKAESLTDMYDDLEIRCLCFAFGTSPQRLMRMMNRASAEESQNAAELEGLMPWLDWLTNVLNRLVQLKMGLPQYEVTFEPDREVDVLKQAQADKSDVSTGIQTLNGVRLARGLDPYNIPEADMPIVITAAGVQPIGVDDQIDVAQKKIAAGVQPDPTAPPPDAEEDDEGGENKPPAKKPGVKKVFWGHCTDHERFTHECGPCFDAEVARIVKARVKKKPLSKRKGARIEPGKLTPAAHAAKVKIADRFDKVFRRQKDKALEVVRTMKKLRKASETPDEIADQIIAAIDEEWGQIPTQVAPELEEAMRAGIAQGMTQLNFTSSDLIQKANAVAQEFASERAAEMIGMRYDDEGNLVENPDAEWVIADTTRDKIRSIVTDAFADESDITKISDAIQSSLVDDDAGIFSTARAEMIARTEVSNAQVQGNFNTWRSSGVVQQIQWLISDDNPCDECADNDQEIIDLGDTFDSGDMFPPVHPNCQCVIVAYTVTEDDGD